MSDQPQHLQRLLKGLSRVDAPANFEIELKARINRSGNAEQVPPALPEKSSPFIPYSIAASVLLILLATYITTRTDLLRPGQTTTADTMAGQVESVPHDGATTRENDEIPSDDIGRNAVPGPMAERRQTDGRGVDQTGQSPMQQARDPLPQPSRGSETASGGDRRPLPAPSEYLNGSRVGFSNAPSRFAQPRTTSRSLAGEGVILLGDSSTALLTGIALAESLAHRDSLRKDSLRLDSLRKAGIVPSPTSNPYKPSKKPKKP